MITFTPLSGDAHESNGNPLAYLLQVDDVKILLDCGSPDWNPEFIDEDGDAPWTPYCQALRSFAHSIDLVLLSHGDLQHCGLYPYAFAHWNLRAPAYCTYPIQAMGRVAVLDELEALRAEQSFAETDAANDADPPVDADGDAIMQSRASRSKYVAQRKDVQDAFDSLITMRYSQPTHLQGKCQGLTITPFSAGHTLGGTIWKIRSPSVGTIVYAVDMNHMRERHLDGTVLFRSAPGAGATIFEPLARPDVLITDADKTLVVNARRKDRDAALLELVSDTLGTRSHSLLMPCDSSTRVLELLVLFDQHWSFSKMRAPICLVSRTGAEMLTFVRSMMEWLGGTISKEDVGEKPDNNNKGGNRKRKRDDEEEDAIGAFALRFRHLEFFTTYAQLTSTYPSSKPKLILAVPQNISHGSSRAIFTDFASVVGNVVVLTSKGEQGTLSRMLFDKWNEAQRDGDQYGAGTVGEPVTLNETLKLRMHTKVPLQGAELETHLQAERAAQEREAKQAAALARAQLEAEADDEESDSDESQSEPDDDGDGKPAEPLRDAWHFDSGGDTADANRISFDIYMKGSVARPTSFFKATEGQTQRFKMFPYVERRRRVDAFGEVVDVAMWLRKGKALETGAESEEALEAKRKKAAEEEAKKAQAEPPSKFVTTEAEVQLACRLFFVDMEGLNDSRAVKTIVPQVNPRKMILVHSTTAATNALKESCSSIRAMTKDIYTPWLGDSVQIGEHINSFSLSLSEELLASIKMSRFEDTEVGYVAGRLVAHASSSIPVLEPLAGGKTEDGALQAAAPAARRQLGVAQLPQSTMIGDLKLTALKARLAAIGIPAEFAGEGVLVCGDFVRDPDADPNAVVAVRKMGRGKVVIEGGVCDVYYTIRREVYALHAIVATT
ncbi:hypothetical protein AURDEDRAFT_183466 [Auricularia subglabra TFB-10046 SS5]|nr:hypothetical protein AURDEDRAFT_183466 [Auricularia subglabra TFB-10046 SS5]